MIPRQKTLIYTEKYHDNCHDYLKKVYLEKYAAVKYKKLLYEIQRQIPKINICEETPIQVYTDIIVCDQHAVIFGHNADIYPALATYALNACVSLILYIPQFKIAALAHIDGLPGYSNKSANDDGLNIDFDPIHENIKIILKKLRQMATTTDLINIKYYLIGGIFDLSEVMINDIIKCINEVSGYEYNFIFKGRNILGPENQSRNICFDTRNGKITYFDYITNLEVYLNNLGTNGLPVNIIKAPRISEAILDITYEPNNFIM